MYTKQKFIERDGMYRTVDRNPIKLGNWSDESTKTTTEYSPEV
jgi:hypothetical protein